MRKAPKAKHVPVPAKSVKSYSGPDDEGSETTADNEVSEKAPRKAPPFRKKS